MDWIYYVRETKEVVQLSMSQLHYYHERGQVLEKYLSGTIRCLSLYDFSLRSYVTKNIFQNHEYSKQKTLSYTFSRSIY